MKSSNLFKCTLILLFMALPLSMADCQVQNKSYSLKDGEWVLNEAGLQFPVEKDVLTIKFSRSLPAGEQAALLNELQLTKIRSNRLGYFDVSPKNGEHSIEAAKRVLKNPHVVYADPGTRGFYSTNDPAFSDQWALNNTGAGGGTPDADIDAVEAWTITTGDHDIIVAPLDSGIDYSHKDLGTNLWQNLGEDADKDGQTLIFQNNKWILDPGDKNNIDDDGNGFKDDLIGWDPEHNNNEVMDIMGHGTHVSGIIGARTHNSMNVAGVAGGYGIFTPGVQVMMVQVGDFSPSGSILDDAIIYAADNGARVITLSLVVGQTKAIDDAVDYAYNMGVFIDCASGNYNSSVSYPASLPKIAAVGSSNRKDQRSSYSNFGSNLELIAPGEDIMSTLPGQNHGMMSGTSMAAPHVAGVAGLILSEAPSLTPAQVLQVLRDTADDKGSPGWDQYYGWGRINAYEAVLAVTGQTTLKSDKFALDSALAGTVNLSLIADSANANRNYLVLGSLTGTTPGTPLGPVTLPLNWDLFTNITVAYSNTFFFTNTLGTLDGAGNGSASFNVNGGDLRPLAGGKISFAYFLAYPIDFVSNAVNININ